MRSETRIAPLPDTVPFPAILCLIAALFLNSTMGTTAKVLVMGGMTAPFVIWARYAVQLVAVSVLFRAWRNPRCYRSRRWGKHLLRSAMTVTAGILAYSALRYLQLFEFISIAFTVPIFTG